MLARTPRVECRFSKTTHHHSAALWPMVNRQRRPQSHVEALVDVHNKLLDGTLSSVGCNFWIK